jgi:histidine triad (HIT) family protein
MTDSAADVTATCLFCRIGRGEVAAEVVHEDDLVLAFSDINPKAPTHLLVIPRRHIQSAADLRESDAEMLGRLFGVAAQLARDAGISDRGFRLVTNSGPGAGQSVDHLHFHLMGGRQMGWPPG